MIKLEYPQNDQENAYLGRWVEQRVPNVKYKDFRAIAFFEEGYGVVAVTLFHNYRQTDIEIVHVAEEGRRWALRGLITEVLNYPFSIGCHRVTAVISKGNKKSRKMVQQLGFKQEGKLRRADIDGGDMFVYGLLPNEYRFVRKKRLEQAA